MREFFIGLLVLAMIGFLSMFGVLLLPLFLVLGIFLRFLVGIAAGLFFIWGVGKLTLMLIDYLKKKPDQNS